MGIAKAVFLVLFFFMSAQQSLAQTYVERLSRGVVALPAANGNFISWRFLSTDGPQTTFNLLRDGEVIASDISGATCFTDATGTATSS